MNRKLVINAALIWKELEYAETLTVNKLRSLTKLTELEIDAALDWLKHENKISVSTLGSERQINKTDEVLIYV
ncbi:MAG: winged helix-turn-helix domain-containing protein [Bacteroidales bacterium]